MESTANSSQMLTTGEAAKVAGVEPDTVLKWIKRGWLPAVRTMGGHHRVHVCDLERMIAERRLIVRAPSVRSATHPARCWEYFSEAGAMRDGCAECIVYRVRAGFCFELRQLETSPPHRGLVCGPSCDACPYFRRAHQEPYKILIATADEALAKSFPVNAPPHVEVRMAPNAYAATAMVETFAPDCIVVDTALSPGKWQDLVNWLAGNPHLPGLRIVLAKPPGSDKSSPETSNVMAVIDKPFGVQDVCRVLEDHVLVEKVPGSPRAEGFAATTDDRPEGNVRADPRD